ncbi:hypothetical protein EMMF5_003396 [Cystobasidiomycetes sp. EMM_F5]
MSSLSGSYTMNQTVEEGLQDRKEWSGRQQDTGEDVDKEARREAKEEKTFEEDTRLPGTSDPRTPPEDKSLLQKAYDKVGEVNQKASEQYLAS